MPQQDGSRPRRQWAPDARALEIVGDRWVMVIVRDLAPGRLRLQTLRSGLPGVSAGALESRLKSMAEAGLIERHRFSALPPRVDIELTSRGYALADAIRELARWELRTGWSRPERDEWVDLGACFRLAPFLADRDDPAPADGELALVVLDDAGQPIERYAYVHADGRARLERRASADPAVTIAGTQDAWVHALSSANGAAGKLEITGDPKQAAAFLGLFKAQ